MYTPGWWVKLGRHVSIRTRHHKGIQRLSTGLRQTGPERGLDIATERLEGLGCDLGEMQNPLSVPTQQTLSAHALGRAARTHSG